MTAIFMVIGVFEFFAALIVGHGAWRDAEAAARLAELDRARAAWQSRLAQFRAQRIALLTDPRLGDSERQRRLDALFAGSFTARSASASRRSIATRRTPADTEPS